MILHLRPDLPDARLKGWLRPEDFLELDSACTIPMLQSVGWLEGEHELRMTASEEVIRVVLGAGTLGTRAESEASGCMSKAEKIC